MKPAAAGESSQYETICYPVIIKLNILFGPFAYQMSPLQSSLPSNEQNEMLLYPTCDSEEASDAH